MIEFIYMFILGIVIGSFLNVVGIRTPIRKSIVKPASACMNCQTEIKKYDLIPVFSYFILRGKCRKCKTKLSPIYPIFEFITGLGFVGATYFSETTIELVFSCLMISIMMALTVADLEYRLVPDPVVLFAALTVVPLGIYVSGFDWVNHISAGVGAFLFFLLMAALSGGGIGGGDIKLIGVLGLALGYEKILLLILISSIIGFLVGAVAKKINKENVAVPFVPFMTIGLIIVLFWHQDIWNTWMNY